IVIPNAKIEEKQRDHYKIQSHVSSCDLLCLSIRYREVVDEARHGCEHRANDSARNRIKRRAFPEFISRSGVVANIAGQRENPECDREHDKHRMDGMLANTCRTRHNASSEPAQQQQNQKNENDEANSTGRIISPTTAVTPCRNRANHEN